jgi:phospholipid/cholesterol/gamma-HCH transport system permease protein
MLTTPALTATTATWAPDALGWSLHLPAAWPGDVLEETPAAVVRGRIKVAAAPRGQCNAALAPALWTLLQPLAQRGLAVDLSALPAAVRAPLALALRQPAPDFKAPVTAIPDAPTADAPKHRPAPPQPSAWAQALITLTFLGQVVLALGRLHRRPRVFRGADLLQHMDHMGPGSLPIVSLTVFLVGLMLAYMGGAQLGRIGAQSFIANVVTVGVVRELAALMTGVILAGRVGAAIAAQLGTMTVNEEIDALRTLGIDPLLNLVLPRLLAMLLVAPLLIALAMVVGVLAGLPAALWVYGVPAPEYLNKCLKALTWTHLWIGLFKGTLYTLLVVIAGCREGFYAGHTAQAIGVATTRAVVKALVWIVVAACASTVVLQSLGF